MIFLKHDGFLGRFLTGFSYAFLLNVIVLASKIIYNFFLPKVLSVESFGYWQLYFLYAGLIHFCHLGLVDGVYLKYGGAQYAALDKRHLSAQFWILACIGLLFSSLIYYGSCFLVGDADKLYLIGIVCVDILLFMPRSLLSSVFQLTGMMKQYSYSLLSEPLVSLPLILGMLLCGVRDFRLFILGDCFARAVSLLVSSNYAKEITRAVWIRLFDLAASVRYIRIGIFLLFSNMMGAVIVSVVRLTVEQVWGIAVFSKISLAISIANIVLYAVGAASVVLFPMLKRVRNEQLPRLYFSLSTIISAMLMGCLALYEPVCRILSWWLPAYTESFYYLGLIAPLCLFEMQLALIGNNCMKALRKERLIFFVNLCAVGIIVLAGAAVFYMHMALTGLLMAVLLQACFKMCTVHWILCRSWKMRDVHMPLFNVACSGVFIACSFYVGGSVGAAAFLAIGIVMLLYERKRLREAVRCIGAL